MKSKLIIAYLFVFCLTAGSVQASKVEVVNRQLTVNDKPFFVKGVGYSPIPVGKMEGGEPGWSEMCTYVGPKPLNFPARRFEGDEDPVDPNPDAVGNFTCAQNGSSNYFDANVLDRDFQLIKDMNANVIRTWGGNTPLLFSKADDYGLKVMAGFWINYNWNYEYLFNDPQGQIHKQQIITEYEAMVNLYMDKPSLLMWGLTNENNLGYCSYCCNKAPPESPPCDCDADVQAQYFYQLVNEVAAAGKAVEEAAGRIAHPVIIVMAELGPDLIDNAATLTNIDIIGINSYRGESFDGYPAGTPSLFENFNSAFPDKSMIITEFGSDAWNSCGSLTPAQCIDSNDVPQIPQGNGELDEAGQSQYVTSAWKDIVANSVVNGGVANGGVVFNYADSWNGHGKFRDVDPPLLPGCEWYSSDWTPSIYTHDADFTGPVPFGYGVAPDNLINDEYWGITARVENPDGSVCGTPAGIDCLTPRQAYNDLKAEFDDLDKDGVSDTQDNCLNIANGADQVWSGGTCTSPPCNGGQKDTDQDGYGNVCDCDIEGWNDSYCRGVWDGVWMYICGVFPAYANHPTCKDLGNMVSGHADMNSDGVVDGADGVRWHAQKPYPGPSGLACAGTIPCYASGVISGNQPPVSVPEIVSQNGATITFRGDQSHDPDGTLGCQMSPPYGLVDYNWQFNTAVTWVTPQASRIANPIVTFNSSGTYTVELIVWDNSCKVNTKPITVNIP